MLEIENWDFDPRRSGLGAMSSPLSRARLAIGRRISAPFAQKLGAGLYILVTSHPPGPGYSSKELELPYKVKIVTFFGEPFDEIPGGADFWLLILSWSRPGPMSRMR